MTLKIIIIFDNCDKNQFGTLIILLLQQLAAFPARL